MNELDTTRERLFILRRLDEAFPLSGQTDSSLVLMLVAGGLFLFAAAAFLYTALRKGRTFAPVLLLGTVGFLAVEATALFLLSYYGILPLSPGVCGAGVFASAGVGAVVVAALRREPSQSIVFWVTASVRAALLLLPAILLITGKYGNVRPQKPLWWTLTVGTYLFAVALTALSYLRDSRTHFGWWVLNFFGWAVAGGVVALLPVLAVYWSQTYLSESWWILNGLIAWWTVPALVVGFGAFVGLSGLVRDPANVGRYWAPLLAHLRVLVYTVLAVAFLLPAMQERDKTRRQSRVLMLIDVSPSVANTSDDVSKVPGQKPKTRLDKILDFLTDANAVAVGGEDKVNLVKNITDKNPLFVYRFGKQLDDDSQQLVAGTPWTRDEWANWTKYDFRPVALRGLSEDGRKKAKEAPAWKPDDVGNAEWAIGWAKAAEAEAVPDSLSAEDKTVLKANRVKMETRVDVARSVVTGTDIPNSVTDLLKKEAGNLPKGVILFSDGRSNPGGNATVSAVRELAQKEKIPIFTVAVGEVRENVSIDITDLQSPSATAPDEPVKVTIAADGVGLPGQTVEAYLDIFMPTQDPKKDSPVHTMTKPLKFLPGDPPRGEAEYVIDPEDPTLPEVMTEPAKGKEGRTRQFKSSVGKDNWKLVARIAADKREIFDEKFHITPPREMLVQDRILRVLMVASAPSREYQTLRTLLVREENQGRARVCVLIQNEGGLEGTIVQDVEPQQVLTKFPDRLDLTNKTSSTDAADKFYNLNEYDLVIMFDPDWEEKAKDGTFRISDQSIKNLATWVDNLGGGLMYVAAPLYTFKLARTDEGNRLRPLVDVLPVEPIDSVIKGFGVAREPRRLLLTPTPLADLLRLEDDTKKDDQTAGWEKFFTGNDKYAPTGTNKDFKPARGIYSFYPVKPKRGATTLARYVLLDDKDQPIKGSDDQVGLPYLVMTQPARGRSAFLGSGEIYRIRQTDLQFYDRFWIKMCRFLVANREAKASRGRVLISKEFVSGSPVRVQARILAPNAKPYPADGPGSLNPSFKILQQNANGETIKVLGPFELKARKGGNEFDGYYGGQVAADPKLMPPDNFRYKVVVDVPDSTNDTLEDTFRLRRSDPELDNLRPDFDALQAMAGTLDEVAARIGDPKTLTALRAGATDNAKVKLAFKLTETDKLKLIPQCLDATVQTTNLRGKVDDLWDNEMEPPATAEADIDFFYRDHAFGTARWGRWGMLFAYLSLLLAVGAGVASIWIGPLKWVAVLFAAAAIAFTYLGNPFPLGDLRAQAYELFSLRGAVSPFQEPFVGSLQLGTILAIAFGGLAFVTGVVSVWVKHVKYAAMACLALALLAAAPVFLFADVAAHSKSLGDAPSRALLDAPYLVNLRWGTILALPLAALALTCFVASTFVGGLKWAGLTFLLLAGAATYLAYPFPVGVVIAVVVSLLSFEWMTRKLLRLA